MSAVKHNLAFHCKERSLILERKSLLVLKLMLDLELYVMDRITT